MPPKTRARPRPRAVLSSEPDETTSARTSPVKRGKAASQTIKEAEDDEDAMFMRNRNRTVQGWKKLEKRNEEAQTPTKVKSRGLELDESPSPTSRKIKSKPKAKPLPEWTKAENFISILSSDDDSDVEIIESNEHTPRKSAESTPRPKRKRARSRSRSLTPPPPISASELQETRERVRKALGIQRDRPASPTATATTDETYDVDLPPEFAAIAASVKLQAASAPGSSHGASSSAKVNLKVRWNPHPQDTSAKPSSQGFVMQRDDTFQDLFENIADDFCVLAEALVVTHDGKRVFPASTPSGLGIWSEATLEAFTTNTYEYIRAHRVERALSVDVEAPPESTANTQSTTGFDDEVAASSQSESEAHDDTFKLIVRSGSTEIGVKVRPATTCGAIVASFVKRTSGKNGRPTISAAKAKAARIEFDGEKMKPEMTVGEMELEDGDAIDMLGL